MKLAQSLRQGVFIERLNRFLALVALDEREVLVHVPNSGRLEELLTLGREVILADVGHSKRKTAYDLALVVLPSGLVSADARLPNKLVRQALDDGSLGTFAEYDAVAAEVVWGASRLDFRLRSNGGLCYIEVKSVTLVRGGIGLFPDAPTERGRRHLGELMDARAQGHRAAVIFVVQRADAHGFAPNDETDPAFGHTLRQAIAAGVEAYAYGCVVSPGEIAIDEELPILL